GGCYVHYSPPANQVLLLNDAANGWLGPVLMGSANTLQNSQCSLNAQASSASGSGNNLTVNLALTFKPAFLGAKNIYLQAADNEGQFAVFQQRGTWTPIANHAPAVVSVTPPSGTGSVQTFTFVYSDPDGYTDVNWAQMLFNTSLSSASGCYVHYSPAANSVLLLNDAGNAWMGPVPLGTVNTLQNSQCTVNARSSSASGIGNNLT